MRLLKILVVLLLLAASGGTMPPPQRPEVTVTARRDAFTPQRIAAAWRHPGNYAGGLAASATSCPDRLTCSRHSS